MAFDDDLQNLISNFPQGVNHLASGLGVASVVLEGKYPDLEIVFLFRHPRAKDTIFGFRWPLARYLETCTQEGLEPLASAAIAEAIANLGDAYQDLYGRIVHPYHDICWI